MIDVFVPVLRRPSNAAGVVESWKAHAGPLDELHFICSAGDDRQIEACLHTGSNVLIADWEPGPGDYAKKMNLAFSLTERPWIFLGADDIEFSAGWVETAFRYSGDVIATNDLANRQVGRGDFGTHCLVRRTYVEEQGASGDGPGVLMHEGYDHNFVDRELCGMAQSRRVYSFAKDSIVRHRHPLWKTARWDPTYRKGFRNFHADRELYIKRSHMWGWRGLSNAEKMKAKRHYRDILRQR